MISKRMPVLGANPKRENACVAAAIWAGADSFEQGARGGVCRVGPGNFTPSLSQVGSGTGAPVLISSRPNHVSSPRHVERSMRFSRTTLSCLFRLKGYGTYRAGATFEAAYLLAVKTKGLDSCGARPNEITHRFVPFIGNPHRGEFPSPQELGQCDGVAAVCLDPIARLYGNHMWTSGNRGGRLSVR